MKRERGSTDTFAALRKRAQAFLAQRQESVATIPPGDIQQLVHELDTYQIELELQNADLRTTQEELTQSRKKFSDLFDFAPVGYLTLSRQGLIVECNTTAAELLGRDKGQLLGKRMTDWIVKDDQDVFYLHRNRLAGTRLRQRCELRMKTREGKVFHARLESSVHPSIEGDSGQTGMCVTDISELKQAERALEQSRMLWEQSFDLIGDIVTIQDRSRTVRRANKAALAHAQTDALRGTKCNQSLWANATPCPNCTTQGEESAAVHHRTVITDEASGRIFHRVSTPISNGEAGDFLVCIARDITEQEQQKQYLFEVSKREALGTLASGIADSFNLNLSAITGFAELARFSIPLQNPARDDIEQIFAAARNAAKLVRQLLTFSHHRTVEPPVMAVHLLVRETLSLLHPFLPAGIAIEEAIDEQSGTLRAELTDVQQIIVNLCMNGLQAMNNQQGTLTVRVSAQTAEPPEAGTHATAPAQAYVVLAVSDTGRELDQTDRTHIFEPYYSIGKGSGMGLAVVKALAENLGGFVRVESTAGGGNTFSVFLPRAAETAEIAGRQVPPSETDQLPQAPGGERILLAINDAQLIKMLQRQLEQGGYTVTAVTRGNEALEMLREHPENFDLLIADQALPSLSGNGLLQAALEIQPELAVILYTADNTTLFDTNEQVTTRTKITSKPGSLLELLSSVRQLLEIRSTN